MLHPEESLPGDFLHFCRVPGAKMPLYQKPFCLRADLSGLFFLLLFPHFFPGKADKTVHDCRMARHHIIGIEIHPTADILRDFEAIRPFLSLF